MDIANLQQPKRSYLGRVTQVGQGIAAVAALQGRHSLIVASEDRSLKQFSVLKADYHAIVASIKKTASV